MSLKDNSGSSITESMLMSTLDRRKPEQVETADAWSRDLLSGLEAEADIHGTSEWEDEDRALAVRCIRRMLLRHACTRKKPDDPPCEDRAHYRDVAMMRVALAKLGLPGDLSLLPLADAVIGHIAKERDERPR